LNPLISNDFSFNALDFYGENKNIQFSRSAKAAGAWRAAIVGNSTNNQQIKGDAWRYYYLC
jgi:hypothetical protein